MNIVRLAEILYLQINKGDGLANNFKYNNIVIQREIIKLNKLTIKCYYGKEKKTEM